MAICAGLLEVAGTTRLATAGDPPDRFLRAGSTAVSRAAHQDPNLPTAEPPTSPNEVLASGESGVDVGLTAAIIVLATPTAAPATPVMPAETADTAPTVCLRGDRNTAPLANASSAT